MRFCHSKKGALKKRLFCWLLKSAPLVLFIKSAKSEKKIYMFERSEFVNFPDLSAFYKRGRRSFASFSAVRKAKKGVAE